MTDLDKATFAHYMSASGKNDAYNDEEPTSCCKLFNFVFEPNSTDDAIAKAQPNIIIYKQQGNTIAVCYSVALYEKALQCERVYDGSTVKTVFIGGLKHLVRCYIRGHRWANRADPLNNLARFASSRHELQGESISSGIPLQADNLSRQKPLSSSNSKNSSTSMMTVASNRSSTSPPTSIKTLPRNAGRS